MKKFVSSISAIALVLCFALTACGSQDMGSNVSQAPTESQSTETPSAQPQETADAAVSESVSDPGQQEDRPTAGNGILIAYFTYGENASLTDGVDASSSASIQYRNGGARTGNTGLVAGLIAEATGGQLFSILTSEQYPNNYNDTLDVGQSEKNAGARPELVSHIDDLDSYDIIFLGFPNWWGDMPMAIYSFLDEYDLSGKTIIPFVTSGGSGFSNTIRAIESAEPDATVLEGLSLRDNRSTQAEGDVAEWLSQLGLAG